MNKNAHIKFILSLPFKDFQQINKKIFNKKSVRTVILIFNTQIAVHINIDPIMR